MKSFPHSHRPALAHLATAITLCSLLAAAPAWAGNVLARAGQNPDSTQDVNNGALASASWGPIAGGGFAQATAVRTEVSFAILGHGASASLHLNSGASHRTDYRLWDIDGNQPLPAALASSLNIDFNFRLQGQLAVEPISLSNGNVQWSAAVFSGGPVSQASGNAAIVFGPVPGNIAGEYAFSGDSSLWGNFDQSFSLLHDGASSGVLTMGASGLSANRALSNAQLSLVSLSYTPSTAFAANGGSLTGIGNIGIRFAETGQILAISPVPEPQSWALGLAGLTMMLWLRRRQQALG